MIRDRLLALMLAGSAVMCQTPGLTAGGNKPGSTRASNQPMLTKESIGTDVKPSTDYRIGLGDVLSIYVWKEPEATVPEVAVRSDGKISLPLFKEVAAEGLTPVELEAVLTERLQKLVPGADVTVLVKQMNSKKIYILGAVKKEGVLPLLRPMTVLQAVAEAGGFTDFAKTKKIYVLRRENGQQVKLPYDYQAVIRGHDPGQDIQLRPDDTIVVPR